MKRDSRGRKCESNATLIRDALAEQTEYRVLIRGNVETVQVPRIVAGMATRKLSQEEVARLRGK